MESGPLEFVVIAEAEADARIACDLADRVFRTVAWIDDLGDYLDTLRRWTGLEPGTALTTWADLKHMARDTFPPYGFKRFPGSKGADVAQARKAIRLHVLKKGARAPALLLVRDTDAQRDTRADMDRARRLDEKKPSWLTVVLGVEHPKREAWVLCGFEPRDDDEQAALDALRRELGYAPHEHADRLTAQGERDTHNAKRVLRALLPVASAREAACWQATSLATLRARGTATGLTAFLDEVRGRLLPLLTPPAA